MKLEIRKQADDMTDFIISHLAKIYVNFDEQDNSKHSLEISSQILKIMNMKRKKSNKKLKISELLFRSQLYDNIKNKRNPEELNNYAINSLPNRYDKLKF